MDFTQKVKMALSGALKNIAGAWHHDADFCQPPVDFEKKTGMQGLSCTYVLPHGLSSKELQKYALLSFSADRPAAHEKLSEMWRHLQTCNPYELKGLTFEAKNTENVFHAVMGVASAFLPRDIQLFIDRQHDVDGPHEAARPRSSEEKFLRNKIDVCCGPIGWAPSLATLQSISRQLNSVTKPVAPVSRTQSVETKVSQTIKSGIGHMTFNKK